MLILFDCTRIIARHNSTTPTGIDRVDIRYVDFFRKNASYDVVGVYQKDGIVYSLTDREFNFLIDQMYSVWIGVEGVNDAITEKLKNLYQSTLGSARAIFSKGQTASSGVIDPSIVNLILSSPSTVTYVNCSHHGLLEQDLFFSFKVLLRVKLVFYIHDIIPIDFPEYVREGDKSVHKARMNIVSEFADVVFVNSAYTRDRFIDFLRNECVRVPPVDVFYIGVEDHLFDRAKSVEQKIEDSPYFVCLGTIEPRKNHLLLLQVWRQIILELDGCDDVCIPKLIIIGKRGWNNENVFNFLDLCDVIKPYVVELSGLSNYELASYLRGARALLFPSFVEGWGMPLVEAFGSGVPAVVSDIAVFREASQEKAYLIDPLDAKRWKETILSLSVGEGELREELVKRIESYVIPEWELHFKGVERSLSNLNRVEGRIEVSTFWKEYADKHSVSTPEKNYVDLSFQDKLFKRAFGAKRYKKYVKFKQSPILFLSDAKSPRLRLLAKFLSKGIE